MGKRASVSAQEHQLTVLMLLSQYQLDTREPTSISLIFDGVGILTREKIVTLQPTRCIFLCSQKEEKEEERKKLKVVPVGIEAVLTTNF